MGKFVMYTIVLILYDREEEVEQGGNVIERKGNRICSSGGDESPYRLLLCINRSGSVKGNNAIGYTPSTGWRSGDELLHIDRWMESLHLQTEGLKNCISNGGARNPFRFITTDYSTERRKNAKEEAKRRDKVHFRKVSTGAFIQRHTLVKTVIGHHT